MSDCLGFWLRVRRADSVDLYNLLQVEEGVLSVRTIGQEGATETEPAISILEIMVSPDFRDDFEALWRDLAQYYVISPPQRIEGS